MSLRGDKYESLEEVDARIRGTVVLYKGDPVYIRKIQLPMPNDLGKEIAGVSFTKLPITTTKNDILTRYLSSRHFDLTPFKMGYMDYYGEVIHISRSSIRQYKQGLSEANSLIHDQSLSYLKDINLFHILHDQNFVNMVKGSYPSFKEVIERFKLPSEERPSSVAIGRKFVLSVDDDLDMLFLTYNGVKCGLSDKNSGNLKIPQKFFFLKEVLEENRIPIF